MLRAIKAQLVSMLPRQLSLPARFHYNRLTGRLDPEMTLLQAWARPGTRVLDIGANIGFYAYALARLDVRVECFEPLPACAAVIREYGAPNISVHTVGLSDAAGRAELIVPYANGKLATAQAHVDARVDKAADGEELIEVELRTLDSFNFDDVSFIKIDVEGHEMKVLRGGRATLLRNRPVLLVEIEQRHLHSGSIQDVFDFVMGLGYSGGFLRSSELAPLSSFSLEHDQLLRLPALQATGDVTGYVHNFIFNPVAGDA